MSNSIENLLASRTFTDNLKAAQWLKAYAAEFTCLVMEDSEEVEACAFAASAILVVVTCIESQTDFRPLVRSLVECCPGDLTLAFENDVNDDGVGQFMSIVCGG
tara:strand:+ start:768 stop:1079 length:312 start_codon:yes stop_codon:yes gene_type:complete